MEVKPKTYTENEVVKIILNLRETLSDLEHKQWINWTKYMIDNCQYGESVERWKRQLKTDYFNLPEQEKKSDREWADKVISIILNKFMTPAGFRNLINKSKLIGLSFSGGKE